MKNKIIVLGHTGFIGRNIFKTLKKKSKYNKNLIVKGISTKIIDLSKNSSINKLKKEITDRSTIVICSVIKPRSGDVLELFDKKILEKNKKMITNVVKAIKIKKPKKIIYLSSNAVYGVYKNHRKISEKAKIIADTFYGKSKYLFEKRLKSVLEKKLIIVRPAIVYGFDEKFVSNNPSGFIKLIKSRNTISLWGDGKEIRSFVYIDDLTKIIISLIRKNFYGTLNLGGISSSYINIIKMISKILGIKPNLENKERTKNKIDKTYNQKLFKKILPSIRFTTIENGIQNILKRGIN